MITAADIKARLRLVLTRDEQPYPASPLSEEEVVEMLLALVQEIEKSDKHWTGEVERLEKRLREVEGSLRYKGML